MQYRWLNDESLPDLDQLSWAVLFMMKIIRVKYLVGCINEIGKETDMRIM